MTKEPRSHGIDVAVAVGGMLVLVGSGVLVGGKDVSVGKITTGEVGVVAPPEVGLGNTMGVPCAA